jgi:hypothetical protein
MVQYKKEQFHTAGQHWGRPAISPRPHCRAPSIKPGRPRSRSSSRHHATRLKHQRRYQKSIKTSTRRSCCQAGPRDGMVMAVLHVIQNEIKPRLCLFKNDQQTSIRSSYLASPDQTSLQSGTPFPSIHTLER